MWRCTGTQIFWSRCFENIKKPSFDITKCLCINTCTIILTFTYSMFPCEQLFQCKKESLADFTNSSSPMNISELLTSAGYPHLSIIEERQHPAYECIFLYEVITKRIPSLNDLRKGLASVKVSQKTLLDLLERLPDVQKLVFPPHTGKIDVMMLKLHLEGRETANPINQTTEQFLNA